MTADLRERLVRSNPVPDHTEAAPDGELLRAILATPFEPVPPARRLPRARFLVAAGAAAAVAVVVVGLLPGEQLGPSPAAAQALEQLAAASAAQPAPPPDGWAYTRVRTLYGGTNVDEPPYTVLYPALRESWVAADGSGRIREVPGPPIYLNEQDRERELAAGGRTEAGKVTDRRYRAIPASYWGMSAALPTDPQQLEASLRRHIETTTLPPPEDDATVVGGMRGLISSYLHSPASSAELRAALYRVLGRLEGVEFIGGVTDPEGRVGVGLEFQAGYDDDDAQTKKRLVVDSASGQVLAEQTIMVRRTEWIDAAPGDVIGEIVYLEQGWTDSIEKRP